MIWECKGQAQDVRVLIINQVQDDSGVYWLGPRWWQWFKDWAQDGRILIIDWAQGADVGVNWLGDDAE
jgi:hypothetical protein